MGATPVPASLSLYRGQVDQGIGEPGADIRRGEQYIAADPALANDAGLLRAVRDWLTLDSTPADHARANGRLTGWATFPLGPYTFVVRLGNTGKYGGRDAYFAHARVWQTTALPAGTDPSLYIGIDQCFAERAEAIASRSQGELPAPSPAPMEPILAGKDLATSLTAHLFHAMLNGVPLIVAVPITDFGANSALPRLIAFARGSLPARLRRRCRIRIFSRSPQRLLDPSNGPGGADLILIPNDQTVRDALTAAGRAALLLDEYGERRQGSAPAEDLFAYAGNLLDSAQRFPDQLTAFTNRFDALWPDDGKPPTAAQIDWIALTYNLTVALAGSEAQRGSLFANYLLAQARVNPKVPWSTLIRPEDWARFPQEHLIRFILRADDDLSPGERQLQGLLAKVLRQRGETLASGISAWWSPTDPAKRRRLLELCQPDPPLVSPAASVALTVPLSIDELAVGGTPVTGALRAEYRQGQLGRRQHDADRLLALLDQPGLFELLDQAVRDGVLPAPWQGRDLGAMPGPQAITLARQLLRASDEQSVAAWTGLIPRLLGRLRQEPTGLEAIGDDLRNALYRIDVPRNPERYLDLADAMLQARPGSADELRARLWEATNGLTMVDDPSGLLTGIIEGRWSVVGAGDLLGENDGSLNIKPTAQTAAALLESPAVAERIQRRDLMALGDLLPADAQGAVVAYHARIDTLMRSEPQATTARLIQYGAWLAWRRHAGQRFSAEERHRHAMDWLTSPVLGAYRTGSAPYVSPQWTAPTETDQRRPPINRTIDLTMETWDQVVKDLGPVGYADIDRLTADKTHWPWIYPFQWHQIDAVAAKCDELDALALLAQRIASELKVKQSDLVAWLWQRTRHSKAWSGEPLGWLLGDSQAPPLDLETADRLVKASRAYRQNAQEALVGAIIAALQIDPDRAIAAIDAHHGWSHPPLLGALRRLLLHATLEAGVLRRIELGLEQVTQAALQSGSAGSEGTREVDDRARGFYEGKYPAIAELLSPGLSAREAKRRWPEQVIKALLGPVPGDPAFDVLRRQVRAAVRSRPCRVSDHPLTTLLARIDRLVEKRKAKLRERGWQCLRGVVEQDDSFFHWAELPNGDLVLPLFQLAVSLQPGGAGQAGQLAQCFMTLPVSGSLRKHESWWRALLASVLDETDPGFIRRDLSAGAHLRWAEQTRNAALGLIYSLSTDLPDDELDKFDAAWHRLNIAGF
jgi:hypothetical protein